MCTSKLGQRVVTRWISKRVKGGRDFYCADGVNVGACAPRSHTSIVSIVGFAKSVSSSAAAGARVVPVPFDLPEAATTRLLGSLNGALITGGETDLHDLDSPYMRAAARL